LYEFVSERLSSGGTVRLVERARLDKALTELKLNQTGLVEASAATQLGNVIGARVFISGKLMKSGDDWVCVLKLIDTQTSEIAATRVTAKSDGGSGPLADAVAEAIEKKVASGSFATAGGVGAGQGDAINAVRTRLAGKTLPVVAVRVPENHVGTWVPDPAGENELISVLTRAGYRVVDVSSLMAREPSSWWARLFRGSAPAATGETGQRAQLALSGGFQSSSEIMKNKEIAKLKQNVDLFVVGEAFSEGAGENYGFKSCTARVEVKVIDTKTETVACATSRHSSAADLSELTAGKKALRQSGGEVGMELAKDMADYWAGRPAAGSAAATP